MGKDLKDQLKGIADRNRALGGYVHNQSTKRKPSLLFDEQEAANIDNDTIFEIGEKGMTALCELEPQFLRFHSTFFARTAMENFDRSLKTAEENKEIDRNIKAFLRLCQPFFMERCCQQALEWMIRGFRINELNVSDCMDCLLPYHDTPEFVRFVQILYFSEEDLYGFLFVPVKQGGQPVTREFLAKRCLVDRRILERAIDAFKVLLDSQEFMLSPIDPRFVSVLCAEYLDRVAQVDSIVASLVIPFAKGLLSSRQEGVKISGLLIFGCLFERCPLLPRAEIESIKGLLLNTLDSQIPQEIVMLLARMSLLFSDMLPIEKEYHESISTIVESMDTDNVQIGPLLELLK